MTRSRPWPSRGAWSSCQTRARGNLNSTSFALPSWTSLFGSSDGNLYSWAPLHLCALQSATSVWWYSLQAHNAQRFQLPLVNEVDLSLLRHDLPLSEGPSFLIVFVQRDVPRCPLWGGCLGFLGTPPLWAPGASVFFLGHPLVSLISPFSHLPQHFHDGSKPCAAMAFGHPRFDTAPSPEGLVILSESLEP
jgi:hypothetical protein